MKRVLSSIGVGSATVDTILPKSELTPGETVELTVELEGGDSTQEIEAIYFTLLTQVDGEAVVLDEFELPDSLSLESGASRTRTTDMTVPRSTPLTRDGQRVWLETRLDIDWAVDPTDEDTVEIVPGDRLDVFLEVVEELGFSPAAVTTRTTPWLDRREFLQAFSFAPDGNQWPDLDGLTAMPVVRSDSLRVFVEIDEQEDAEHLTDQDFDKQQVSMTFETTNAGIIRRQLESTIESHTNV